MQKKAGSKTAQNETHVGNTVLPTEETPKPAEDSFSAGHGYSDASRELLILESFFWMKRKVARLFLQILPQIRNEADALYGKCLNIEKSLKGDTGDGRSVAEYPCMLR